MSPVSRVGRRHFLRGVGAFTLALPFMPSLLPRASAQASVRKPRFIAMATQHGGIWGSNMYPADRTLTQLTDLYSDHDIRRGDLTLSTEGSRASLSPVLSASTSALTSALASKMNVIRGLDLPFYIGHHTGGHLGNFARNDGNGDSGKNVQGDPRPTIDQVMAFSPSFYPDLSATKERSIHVGGDGGFGISWGYANPANQSGEIQPLPTAFSSRELFSSIFVPPDDETDQRVPVVDRVFASYQRLRNGTGSDARRLSRADRQRLDDHMDRLAELQRKVGVRADCGDVSEPVEEVTKQSIEYGSLDTSRMREVYQVFNDVIAAAMICGTSRIATLQSLETFSSYAGDWHQDVAHQADLPDGVRQKVIADAHQLFFEGVFVDLMNKLNYEEADGQTYLDNTLMMWTQESGMVTHDSISMPVITAGSAAGYFRTGNYVDYRNRDNLNMVGEGSEAHRDQRPGILYTGWLASVLQAMNVPPSEFERAGEKGYGSPYRDDYFGSGGTESWPERLFDAASDVVPLLKA